MLSLLLLLLIHHCAASAAHAHAHAHHRVRSTLSERGAAYAVTAARAVQLQIESNCRRGRWRCGCDGRHDGFHCANAVARTTRCQVVQIGQVAVVAARRRRVVHRHQISWFVVAVAAAEIVIVVVVVVVVVVDRDVLFLESSGELVLLIECELFFAHRSRTSCGRGRQHDVFAIARRRVGVDIGHSVADHQLTHHACLGRLDSRLGPVGSSRVRERIRYDTKQR